MIHSHLVRPRPWPHPTPPSSMPHRLFPSHLAPYDHQIPSPPLSGSGCFSHLLHPTWPPLAPSVAPHYHSLLPFPPSASTNSSPRGSARAPVTARAPPSVLLSKAEREKRKGDRPHNAREKKKKRREIAFWRCDFIWNRLFPMWFYFLFYFV